MATADQGVQPGYTGPEVETGDGVESGPAAVFFGAHSGQGDPTLQGYVKKRPVLGDTTVLDQLQQ